MKIKIRHGLARWQEPRDDGRDGFYIRTAFRAMTVDVPEDEAKRLLAGPDPAAVAVEEELKKDGKMSPVPTAAGAEELKAWVSVANDSDIDKAIEEHPELADRIRDARSLYEADVKAQNLLQGGVPATGSNLTPPEEKPEGEGADEDGIENLGGNAKSPEEQGGVTPLGEGTDDQFEELGDLIGTVIGDDELDNVVKGSVEKVSEFLAERPDLAQRVLDAETRRAEEPGAKPFRAGVQEAARVAASHTGQ